MSRRMKPHPNQMAFTFESAPPATEEASLAGLDQFAAACVSRALCGDGRPRAVIAGCMSALLNQEVSKEMLDAYSSEARRSHNISYGRYLALTAVTGRFDLLDSGVMRIGGRVLVGEEINTARLGHLRAKLAQLQAELKDAERTARPITRGGAE